MSLVETALHKVVPGVPMPVKFQRIYPFQDMMVGDSFLTDNANVRASANWYGKCNDKGFTVRKEGNLLRCWRVK